MSRKKATFYEILVYIAYTFYILFGAAWFVISFLDSGHFNTIAFSVAVIFGVQAYYRHRLTNLILGVLTLFFSIFMLMEVISTFDLMAPHASYDGLIRALLAMGVLSIIMSIILVFSYLKMSFREE